MNNVELKLKVVDLLHSGEEAGEVLSGLKRGSLIFHKTKVKEKKAIAIVKDCIERLTKNGHRISTGGCREPGNLAPGKYFDQYSDNFHSLLNQKSYLGFRVVSVGTGTGRYNYIPATDKKKDYVELNRIHRYIVKRNRKRTEQKEK